MFVPQSMAPKQLIGVYVLCRVIMSSVPCSKRGQPPHNWLLLCFLHAGNTQLSYVGCLPEPYCISSDPYNRAMQLLSQLSNTTVHSCVELAAASGYAYAAVQTHPQIAGTTQCFGAHNLNQYSGRGTCHTPCTGNPNQMCGSACTHSVYRVKGSVAVGPAQSTGEGSLRVYACLHMWCARWHTASWTLRSLSSLNPADR